MLDHTLSITAPLEPEWQKYRTSASHQQIYSVWVTRDQPALDPPSYNHYLDTNIVIVSLSLILDPTHHQTIQ